MVDVEGGRGGMMQATPVVVDGTMYLSTGHLSAIDAATGAVKWRYPKDDTAGLTGRGSNRGVAVAELVIGFSPRASTRPAGWCASLPST